MTFYGVRAAFGVKRTYIIVRLRLPRSRLTQSGPRRPYETESGAGSKAAHIASMSTTTLFPLVCLSLDTTLGGSFA